MQAPKIDNRTFRDLVAQAETLAQVATNDQWHAGAAESVAAAALAGRVLDQDIVAQIVATAGSVVDAPLAERLRATPGVRLLLVADPNSSASPQIMLLPEGDP